MNKKYLPLFAVVFLLALAGYYLMLRYQVFEPSETQEQVYTIGILRNPPSIDPAWAGFVDGMAAKGYQEGQNVRYLIDEVGSDLPSTKEKVKKLVDRDIDMLYVMGNLAGRASKEVTQEIKPELPVVFGVISNPIAAGLAESMQRPGKNITGITPYNEVTVSKRLELFKEMLSGNLKRVIFAWFDPATTGIENLRVAALALNLELVEKRVQNRNELQAFLEELSFEQGDGILRATDAISGSLVNEIIALSLEKKVPLSGTNSADAQAGALMSYGANYYKVGQQASRLAEAILKGANPAEIPVELPDSFEFVINLKTANLLDLTIPEESLSKATRIIFNE